MIFNKSAQIFHEEMPTDNSVSVSVTGYGTERPQLKEVFTDKERHSFGTKFNVSIRRSAS